MMRTAREHLLLILVGLVALAAAAFLVFVPDWTHPPIEARQFGPGPSMVQFDRGQMPEPVSQAPLPPLPAVTPGGQLASAAYKNVQVLNDLDAPAFMRLQQAITQWVSPKEGCGFCHAGNDYASDARPQKQVARLMIQMVRHVNTDWTSHVGQVGVTCYTCHRGQPAPADIWFPRVPRPPAGIAAKQENWNEAADNVRKFFPDAGWDLYLLRNEPISVQSTTALPSGQVSQPIVAKRVYEMMMQMSDGIGVNCGYCHNSRALADWSQSTPARWLGQSGIDMTRDLNQHFLLKLPPLLPQSRERVTETTWPVLPARETGPQDGNGLVLCATCHMARPKPLEGAAMAAAYPGLTSPHNRSIGGQAMNPHPYFQWHTPFDTALLLTWAFFIFFGGLVYWLRREDKREGYPMVDVTPIGRPIEGFPPMPGVKQYTRLFHEAPTAMPHNYGSSRARGQRLLRFPGAPLVPIGNPLLAEIGPGAYPLREDEPLLSDGKPQVVPLRVAAEWSVAKGDSDPRGLPVLDSRATPVGTVTELWVDKGVKILRYLEVTLSIARAPGRVVLVPIYDTDINPSRGRIRVRSLLAYQFADVPGLADPDQVTAREEDRINAYYAAGLVFSRGNDGGLPMPAGADVGP